MTVGERIKALRKEKGISVDKLAESICKDRATIYRYESMDIEKMPTSVLEPLAKALGTTPAYLMGWDEDNKVSPLPAENIYMRPVYNSAAAGFNILAQDTIVDYMPTFISSPSEQERYIWVNVVGDSMSPLIENDSMVLVKLQDSVDSGQIAIVLIDDEEASVKRLVYGKNWIELQSVNPYYPPRRFEGAEVQRIRVMGLVKKVSKDIN